jgi:hypothetical protein
MRHPPRKRGTQRARVRTRKKLIRVADAPRLGGPVKPGHDTLFLHKAGVKNPGASPSASGERRN